MIQVVYQLFNSFGFRKEFVPFLSKKESERIEGEMQKPLWVEINRPEFEELKRDIYDNQDDKDFKINISKITYE